ncbi:Uu.00g064780.m01.CDS01 [Anthostomella pinea]|uniref:Uu.00g064780.m01.CDS01 n=1 Tax=Anthostomella pinea TaxID=933095 RepID=A0AAI8VTN3_9PEZI|nr:Uu.00g064780.m01.CDS01 [Anthostomella pinea]
MDIGRVGIGHLRANVPRYTDREIGSVSLTGNARDLILGVQEVASIIVRVKIGGLARWCEGDDDDGELLYKIFPKLPAGITVHRDLPSNYTYGDITWSGFAEVGAEKQFQGTWQQVEAQIRVLQPNFKFVLDQANRTIEARDKEPPSDVNGPDREHFCEHVGGFGEISYFIAENLRNYLQALSSDLICRNGPGSPGKGNCGRISCAYDSAIWWCNDNDHPVTFKCNLFEEYAARIVDNL